MTNLSSLEAAIAAYKRRFNIEQLFGDLKKVDYNNLEDADVASKPLIYLILVLTIAPICSTIQCQQIERKRLQKYIDHVKESGRDERRHRRFFIGLYSHNWLNFKESCQELGTALMKVNTNKLKYYQQGLRDYEASQVYILADLSAPSDHW